MTAPQERTSPPRRPVPDRRGEPRRPPLRAVPDPASTRARRLIGLFTAIAGLAALFGLFGVVSVHVMLAQGQDDVRHLQAQRQEAQDRQQRLRLQVAELESPARVVAAAKGKLGMVTPPTVVPLAPGSLTSPPDSLIPGPTASTTVAPPTTTAPRP